MGGATLPRQLLVINTKPLPGFARLVDYLVDVRTWRYGPYHISILRGDEWRDETEEAKERATGRVCMELIEEGVAADPNLHLLSSQGFPLEFLRTSAAAEGSWDRH